MQFDFNFPIMYKLGTYAQDVDQLLRFSPPHLNKSRKKT